MFESIFSSGTLRDYIDSNVQDPWEDTPFKGYVFMSPKQKGEFERDLYHATCCMKIML